MKEEGGWQEINNSVERSNGLLLQQRTHSHRRYGNRNRIYGTVKSPGRVWDEVRAGKKG